MAVQSGTVRFVEVMQAMAKFAVLDPSLTSVGGHPYELAVRMLQAADRLGYTPVLVSHRCFAQRNALPAHWQVLGVFSEESYRRIADYPLDMAGRPLVPLPADVACRTAAAGRRWEWCSLRRWWRRRQCRRFIAQYAAACAAIDSAIGLRRGDHVLLPTASLWDLLGLARFLTEHPGAAPGVTWHALFHRGFLQGREPEYEAQAGVAGQIRAQFEYLAQHLEPGQLRLYGTSSKLAEQFNRLSPITFGVLPYAVDGPVLANLGRERVGARLRLICAGFLRREKGKMLARRLVEGIWDEQLMSGRMQLVVQTNRRQARRIVSRRSGVPLAFHARIEPADVSPILWLRHPLARDAYVDAIRQADIAVFLHDGRAYYTQCSGVLVEMLAAGVPVLVPAGSWLAEQISEAIYQHLDQLRATAPVVAAHALPPNEWHSPLPRVGPGGPAFRGPSATAACALELPTATWAALLTFQWNPLTPPGTYLRVVAQHAEVGAHRAHLSTTAILGARTAGQPVSTLVPLDGRPGRLTVHLSNAYDDTRVSVRDVEVHLLGAPTDGALSYPAGRVGLTFADVDQLPSLVRNLREHYAHYLDSARAFARAWRADHDAQHVVQCLLAGTSACQRAVA